VLAVLELAECLSGGCLRPLAMGGVVDADEVDPTRADAAASKISGALGVDWNDPAPRLRSTLWIWSPSTSTNVPCSRRRAISIPSAAVASR
jgi:hypothetical protein